VLTKEIIASLGSYTASMQNDVTFVLHTGEHSKRAELLAFLQGIAGVSPRGNSAEPGVRGSKPTMASIGRT